MYLRMSFSCFLFSQFGLLLPLIEEHLNLCQKSMMELFAKIVKALVFYFFHILPKERCSLFHLNGTSRDIHFFVIFSLLFIIILSRKTDWVPHEKIKLTLLRFLIILFQNILFLRVSGMNWLFWATLPKLKSD